MSKKKVKQSPESAAEANEEFIFHEEGEPSEEDFPPPSDEPSDSVPEDLDPTNLKDDLEKLEDELPPGLFKRGVLLAKGAITSAMFANQFKCLGMGLVEESKRQIGSRIAYALVSTAISGLCAAAPNRLVRLIDRNSKSYNSTVYFVVYAIAMHGVAQLAGFLESKNENFRYIRQGAHANIVTHGLSTLQIMERAASLSPEVASVLMPEAFGAVPGAKRRPSGASSVPAAPAPSKRNGNKKKKR